MTWVTEKINHMGMERMLKDIIDELGSESSSYARVLEADLNRALLNYRGRNTGETWWKVATQEEKEDFLETLEGYPVSEHTWYVHPGGNSDAENENGSSTDTTVLGSTDQD